MITKNHPNAYGKLFTKAKEILTQYGKNYNVDGNIVIDDIDDYFCYLQTLAQIEKDHINIDPIFTILPATEATFDIDADKRSITIPANFKDHGVGVQGDEIAEILYFSIDRYFDAMDLADMDIVVQWKHEKDADYVSNLSATYKKSLTLQPGKIVFGWPITSEVTERAGNIKFSIRFYRRNENKLEYSFSTLTETIKIRDGLDFNIEEADVGDIINRNDMIYKNLRNSIPTNIDTPVATPVFTHRWISRNDVEANKAVTGLENATSVVYDDIITFVAKAVISPNAADNEYINNNGLIYEWYDAQGNRYEGVSVFKLVDKTAETYNPKETYYYLEAGSYIPYAVHGDLNPYDDVDKNGEPIDLFVRCGAFKPAAAGTYHAVAINKQSQTSLASARSGSWMIAGPAEPEFIYEPNGDKLVIDPISKKVNVVIETKIAPTSDEWYYKDSNAIATKLEGATGATYEATQEGWYFRKVTNTKNGNSISASSDEIWVRHQASEIGDLRYYVNGVQVTNLAIDPNQTVEVKFDVLDHSTQILYQWYRNGEAITGATTSAYNIEQNGNYYCVITNTYKETESSPKQSDTFKV